MLEQRLHDLTHEVEALKKQLDKRSTRTRKEAERKARPTINNLTRELEHLRSQINKRGHEVIKDVEKRAEPVLRDLAHEVGSIRSQVEKRSDQVAHDVEKKADPVLHDLAREVENLRARLDEGQKQARHELAQRIEPQREKDVVQYDPAADIGAFIIGLLIGALLAALAALWFAPQSGEKTRHDIQERGMQIREQAEHTAAEARTKIEGPNPSNLIAEAKTTARLYKEGDGREPR